MIRALGKSIIFEFEDTVTGGKFDQVSQSGIVVVGDLDNTLQHCRFGKVLSVGRDVDECITVGTVVLIEPLQWTEGVKHEGKTVWMTTADKIVGIREVDA